MSVVSTDTLAQLRPSRETLVWGALVINAEVLLVGAYLIGRGDTVTITRPAMLVLPFVWINVAAWAILRTRPAPSSRRNHLVAGAIGGSYFLVLAYVGGLVGGGVGPPTGVELSVASIPPGWGPILFYQGSVVDVTLMPYKVVGYGALAYLVYATALDAANALVGGVVGLFTCVSCTFPVIASVLTGIAGSGTALAGLAYSNVYLLSTGVFVLTVGLLYWRPFTR
ncbi:MAG: hypothetical protein V5A43_04185 [Haloarculaceae archaeon]